MKGTPFNHRLKMELSRSPCIHFVLGIMVFVCDYTFVVNKRHIRFISSVLTALKELTKFQIIMLSRLDGQR